MTVPSLELSQNTTSHPQTSTSSDTAEKTALPPRRIKRKEVGSGRSSPASFKSLTRSETEQPSPHRPTTDPPLIPMPMTMNDPNWLEYVERSSLLMAPEMPIGVLGRPRVNTNPLPIPPEFTRLRSNSTSGQPTITVEGLGGLSVSSALPKMQQMLSRRSLKTPTGVLRSSQKSKSQDHGRGMMKKRASVELIAEQYRAILDYKDRLEEGFAYDEDEAEDEDVPPPVPRKDDEMDTDLPLLEPTIYSASAPPRVLRKASPTHTTRSNPEVTVEAPRPADPPTLSPQSDGTLVGFEEDVIYFKPVSFGPSPPASPSPETLSPPPHKSSQERPRSKKENRQLDIGMDLLNSELSSTLARGPRHNKGEDRLSDLQLSIMIDAYENLRERTKNMDNLGSADRENVSRMFDSWVGTLHSIRGSLASSTAGGRF